MRTNYSIKNSFTSFISYFIISIITIISQRIFIYNIGIDYLGLNTLFKNIFTMLSLFEFGMSTVIIYYFYKPVYEKDNEKINTLTYFTKKAYYFIMLTIFIVGLILIPFLKLIVKSDININIYIVYILFLLSSILTYFISYKKCIIIAHQKNYVINIIHMLYTFLVSIIQIIVILLTKNYYLYLICNIFSILIENLIINIYVNAKYSYITTKNSKKIDESLKKEIFSKMKAYFLDKFGTIILYNTDPIIISIFLGLKTLGIYSNYLFILNGVDALFNGIISSLTASIGNLLVENSSNKNYEVFKKIRFINLCITIFTSSMILTLSKDFIIIWVGKKYLFTNYILIILVIIFYKDFMKYSFKIFKHAAGIWVEDRFVPIISSILNITFSIIFLKIFGLIGIFIGTLISSIPTWFYDFPKFIYKKLFNKSYKDYYREMSYDLVISIFIISFIYILLSFISFKNIIITLLIKLILGILINIILFIIIFKNREEFKYFLNLFKEKIRRRKI